MATLVGLVPGVGPDVLLQVGELGELPLADLAAVGLDAQVDPGVLGQVGTVREGFVTAGALVGLRLPQVDLGVKLQVSFARKSLEKNSVKLIRLMNRKAKSCKLAKGDHNIAESTFVDIHAVPVASLW